MANVTCQEKHLTLHQIFNCDETGLNFRLLPNKTQAAHFEKSADGRKKSKDRVTIMPVPMFTAHWKVKGPKVVQEGENGLTTCAVSERLDDL